MIANIPVTTLQGVNHTVTAHRLPLYLKAFEFVDRHEEYRQLALHVTRNAASDRERVQAVFDWTVERIQPQPDGWALVDDHILNIIIRGYGVNDQQADVFATLLTYAGVPAFWMRVNAPGTRDGVLLTFAKVDDRWIVADVANKCLFKTATGSLAAAEDFAAKRVVIPGSIADVVVGATAYSAILNQLQMPAIPRPLRAELQMPWPRLWHVAKRAVGYERDHGTEE